MRVVADVDVHEIGVLLYRTLPYPPPLHPFCNRFRPRGMIVTYEDPTSLMSRMAKKDVHFAEMWQEARRLVKCPS